MIRNYEEFKKSVEDFSKDKAGVLYYKVGKTPDDRDIAVVIGWQDAFRVDEEDNNYYRNGDYILSCKVAYNNDNLQYDYIWDWYMPTFKDSEDVSDTEIFLTKESLKEDYIHICQSVEEVLNGFKEGELDVIR